jgi:hypothetical protein
MHSIQTLMDGLIDYAGLFPPADLEMEPAVRNFAEYRSGANDWMLSRLIVPVGQLEEFERCAGELLPVSRDPASDDCWVISALTASVDHDDFESHLAQIEAFNERHLSSGSGAVVVDTIECLAADAAGIDHAFEMLPDSIFPYFELDHRGDIRGQVAAMAGMDSGAKIRTGGMKPEAHPTPTQLARFITVCANAEVPFKATAGLHHPLRHHAESVGCAQFGFLNVFIGSVLAWNGRCEEDVLVRLLEAETLEGFQIDDDRLGFDDQHVALDQIAHARERFCHSYGSCSFLEPLEDLLGLELLSADPAAS